MKRPLALVTLVYVAGLLAGDLFPLWPDILLPLSLASAVVSLFTLLYTRSTVPSTAVLWPLIFFTGWANLSCRTSPLSPYDLRNLNLAPAELVIVRGTLSETPAQRVFVHDDKESYRFLANVRLNEMRREKDGWQPAFGTVLVLTPGILPSEFFGGQTVEVSGVLSKPPRATAEGLFDYAAYLSRQGVYYQVKTDGTNDWTLLSRHGTPPLSDRFLAWAHRALARGLPTEDEPLKMLWAMTLGWKTVDNTIYEPFMKSGTMHIFAISGLDIALIAGIFVALLRVLQVPRPWCGAIVVPAIWFYTGATGWQPSAIRSAIMMTIIIGGWALSRPSDLINSLAASALCILLWDPQQVFGASFQLSFFVVLSIALLLPGFETARDRWVRVDPLLPRELIPPWKRRGLVALRWVTSSLAISLAAWAGSLPLTAYYFHLCSPVTLLANIVVVPLSSGALAANLGSLLCAGWCGWIAELFNHSAWLCMRLMISASEVAICLPLACRWVEAPAISTIVIYFGLVFGLLTGVLLAPKRRRLVGVAAAAALVVMGWSWCQERSVVSLTVIPLSGGHCVYMRHPRLGPDMLADCGRSNAVQVTVEKFLHAQGINQMDAFILTHGDINHAGGAGLVRAHFSPAKVYASSVRFRSKTYRDAVQCFEESGKMARVDRDSKIGPWRVLHPGPGDRFSQADDNALVLSATLNGTRVILLSDLGEAGQAELLRRYPTLQSDIVITGLPTSGQAVTAELFEQLKPRLVVVADSEYPAYERAKAGFQSRLRKTGIQIISTRYMGAATIEMRKSGWSWRTVSGAQGHGRATAVEAADERSAGF